MDRSLNTTDMVTIDTLNPLACGILDLFKAHRLTADQAIGVLALVWQRIKQGELETPGLAH